MAHQMVVVLDFGGQYNQLIARRVRECGVYCEVRSYKTSAEEISAMSPVGIIFTGGPNSVYDENSPKCETEIFELGIPILGICYGAHLMAHMLGGKVTPCESSEYGMTETFYDKTSVLYCEHDIHGKAISCMSHTELKSHITEGIRVTAHT